MNPRVAPVCFAIFFIAIALAPLQAFADQPSLQRLRVLGATVKEDDGVVVDLRVDCADLTDADYKVIGALKTLEIHLHQRQNRC